MPPAFMREVDSPQAKTEGVLPQSKICDFCQPPHKCGGQEFSQQSDIAKEGPTSSAYTIPNPFYPSHRRKSSIFKQKYGDGLAKSHNILSCSAQKPPLGKRDGLAVTCRGSYSRTFREECCLLYSSFSARAAGRCFPAERQGAHCHRHSRKQNGTHPRRQPPGS